MAAERLGDIVNRVLDDLGVSPHARELTPRDDGGLVVGFRSRTGRRRVAGLWPLPGETDPAPRVATTLAPIAKE
jgi:hypothetical protein